MSVRNADAIASAIVRPAGRASGSVPEMIVGAGIVAGASRSLAREGSTEFGIADQRPPSTTAERAQGRRRLRRCWRVQCERIAAAAGGAAALGAAPVAGTAVSAVAPGASSVAACAQRWHEGRRSAARLQAVVIARPQRVRAPFAVRWVWGRSERGSDVIAVR